MGARMGREDKVSYPGGHARRNRIFLQAQLRLQGNLLPLLEPFFLGRLTVHHSISNGASYFAMLKLLSRQLPKALRNPFRSLLPAPLCGPLQSRHLHIEPVPFSGPPSYASLARRSSPWSPNPIHFFAQKKAKEAIERGEFVDVHDIAGVDPKDYDVLITDMDNDTLHSDISKLLNIPYLKEATKDETAEVAKEIHGFMYGQKLGMIFPCVVSIRDQARWVFFIVNPRSPLTFISSHVSVHHHRTNTLATNLTLGGTILRS